MGAAMNQRIVALATFIALMTIVVGANEIRVESRMPSVKDHAQLIDRPNTAEPSTPLRNISVTKRATSLGFDENSSELHSDLSCLQLQVIDEVDFLGGAECD
jgi:hypothetical protein